MFSGMNLDLFLIYIDVKCSNKGTNPQSKRIPNMKITDFDSGLKEQVALVDFSAPWCGPCRQMAPIIKKLTEKYKDRAAIVEIDIDSQPLVATHYMVQSIPTLILFDHGREIKRFVGVQSTETLEKHVDDVLIKKS
jgi:thioredoxin 1